LSVSLLQLLHVLGLGAALVPGAGHLFHGINMI